MAMNPIAIVVTDCFYNKVYALRHPFLSDLEPDRHAG